MCATTGVPELEWADLWAALQANYDAGRVVWVRTTAAVYEAMLGAVPPAWRVGLGFLAGDPWDHDAAGAAVYPAFTHRAGVYETCYLTLEPVMHFEVRVGAGAR